MLNYLWAFMIIAGVIYAAFTGTIEEVSLSAIASPKDAVTLCITMLGVMLLWMGVINIAKQAGLIASLTKLLKPVLKLLFPAIPPDHIVLEYISTNIVSNMLGLGWAATPMGLKAMKELSRLNKGRSFASTSMCTFLIVNISSLQLIPVNVIAYRSEYGSVNPSGIIAAGLIATVLSVIVGILFSAIAARLSKPEMR